MAPHRKPWIAAGDDLRSCRVPGARDAKQRGDRVDDEVVEPHRCTVWWWWWTVCGGGPARMVVRVNPPITTRQRSHMVVTRLFSVRLRSLR